MTVWTGRGQQHKHKTKVAKRTVDPVWRESFSVHGVADDSTKVTVAVIDEDRGVFDADDPLGQVTSSSVMCT